MEFYNFIAQRLEGGIDKMEIYKGKILVIVNTASECGLTPQYEGLEALYQTLQEKGVEVLGYPCNQFGGQEPGDAAQIQSFCEVNYGVTFPMYAKVDVNGQDAHPIFKYLKSALPGPDGEDIKWNFNKFVVGTDGTPLKRFEPQQEPIEVAAYIMELIEG